MEARTRDEQDGPVAPGSYAVAVNPDDFDRLAPHQEYLEREWAELLRELAGRVGITLTDGDAKVRMTARESVPLGAVDVAVAGESGPAGRFHLRMIKGVAALGVYLIEGTARIGRGDENEVVLADPSVSRTHAVLDAGGAEAVLRDLGFNQRHVRERPARGNAGLARRGRIDVWKHPDAVRNQRVKRS